MKRRSNVRKVKNVQLVRLCKIRTIVKKKTAKEGSYTYFQYRQLKETVVSYFSDSRQT